MNYYQIETSKNIVAMASFEEAIDIFSLDNFKIIKQFKTNYYFGGGRISLSSDAEFLFTSDYENNVEGYSLIKGELIYKRTDIELIQRIKILSPYLYVLTDDKILYILNIADDKIIEKKENIDNFFFYKDDIFLLQEKNIIFNGSSIFKLSDDNLAYCFIDDSFFILSHRYKPLIKIDKITKGKLWVSTMKEGFTAQKIKVFENRIFAIFNFITPSVVEFYLAVLDLQTGKLLSQTKLNSEYSDFDFSQDAKFLICSNGDIISVSEQKVINKLELIID